MIEWILHRPPKDSRSFSATLTMGHKHKDMDVALANYRKLLMKIGDTRAEAKERIERILAPLDNR